MWQVYHAERLEDIPFDDDTKEQMFVAGEKAFGEMEKRIFGGEGKGGSWYLGEQMSFVDFDLGGILMGIMFALGEESSEWKRMAGWNEGRWGRFVEGLRAYK